jgi:hypothetical protein
MPITRAPSLIAGVSTNPNTLTRSLIRSYDDLAQGINFLSEVFSYGDLRPVGPDDLATRWSWTVNGSITGLSTIKDSAMGLDGTSIYTYAASENPTVSFLGIDPMFIIENVEEDGIGFNGEKRPATIYESFLNMKTYVDTQVSVNLNPLLSLTSSLEAFLNAAGAGADNGTIVTVENDEFSLSSWKLTGYGYNSVTYPALLNGDGTGILVGDDTFKVLSSNFELLGGPSGGSFVYDTDGFAVETASEDINFTADKIIFNSSYCMPVLSAYPGSLPSANQVKIYYSGIDNALHVVTSEGDDDPIGSGGSGYAERLIPITLSGGGPYTLVPDDIDEDSIVDILGKNKLTVLLNADSNVIYTLPSTATSAIAVEVIVADTSGTASSNNINIYPATGHQIIGVGSSLPVVINTDYGTVGFKWIDSQDSWLILYGR